jgi:hypothetical protein
MQGVEHAGRHDNHTNAEKKTVDPCGEPDAQADSRAAKEILENAASAALFGMLLCSISKVVDQTAM